MTEKVNKTPEYKFIVCHSCQGTGSQEGKVCADCHGMAVALPFYGRFLYWGKTINSLHIFVDRIIELLNKIINLILVLIGLFGVFLLFYLDLPNNFQNLFGLSYWLTPSFEKTIFWFTIISDLYLYYRIIQTKEPINQVLQKIFIKEQPPQDFLDWNFIHKQPAKNKIDISKAFAPDSIKLIEQAWQIAKNFQHSKTDRLHVFAAVPAFNDGAVIWGRLGIESEKFKEKLARALDWQVEGRARQTDISELLHKVLLLSYLEAYDERRRKVQIPEIIKSLINTDLLNKNEKIEDLIEKILVDLELSYQKVDNVVTWIRLQRQLREGLSRFRTNARYKPKSGLDRAMTGVATPFLDKFSTDLTKQAMAGQLFPCIGREKEFEQLYRVLEGSGNGVLLVGNVGVGRTTILHGLAERMVEETVPEALQDKRLVSINVSGLIGGVRPEEAEARLMTLAGEVIKSRNIVLVIEDLHNLVGANSEGGGLDLSEVLAEIMRKRYFLILGTTSPAEYSRVLEKSSLFEVFKPVNINELEINDAIQVCEAKSGPIEYKNNIYFSYDSIEKAVILTDKYSHDKYLPEKALEVLEEVAVNVRKLKGEKNVVTAEDVAVVVAEKTRVKVTGVTQNESKKLLDLEKDIHKRVIGQDEAVKMVSASLRRARAELRDEGRPISNFLFLGPTGVGKTELAKSVSEVYFGAEDKMLRFDMSEFQEKSSIDRLIGNGSEPGVLTEAVRKNPYSLLLCDEIEKAHPDILNLFLQVMDDGRLTDGSGQTIDFTNLIIIMTSNAGAQVIQDKIKENMPLAELKELLINEELKKHYRPEFINRFDGVIVFTPLTMESVIKIARIMAKKVVKRLAEKDILLEITDAAIAELAEQGFDPRFGARPLRRVMQEKVDDTLANYLLEGKVSKRDKIILEPGGKIHVEKADKI
ncbi:hypothetical protein COT97_05920 [Candidatus Falkowbacteria bacterium CG10_big_fil_rev_8_21_14_0_10_39_11]|uniref:Clp R domain-containing protein n=1 Tax=Candidatus Falkowbacteria bacterium CG10_big_fil_rev_8_21_14_0_10_39_11 TaxID=1974565 RepID=A0A2H0V3F3_9BACT|nr:MAG: hypothetical protein COT97_05920 [Candidatus Falkowbacteria bacterium CG10_big_fil_rev_8_21_14_0_10_39_11]